MLRGVLLAVGAVVLPLLAAGQMTTAPMAAISVAALFAVALVTATAGEIVGRYLFFVSVVPKHMTAPYVAVGKEAA